MAVITPVPNLLICTEKRSCTCRGSVALICPPLGGEDTGNVLARDGRRERARELLAVALSLGWSPMATPPVRSSADALHPPVRGPHGLRLLLAQASCSPCLTYLGVSKLEEIQMLSSLRLRSLILITFY